MGFLGECDLASRKMKYTKKRNNTTVKRLLINTCNQFLLKQKRLPKSEVRTALSGSGALSKLPGRLNELGLATFLEVED